MRAFAVAAVIVQHSLPTTAATLTVSAAPGPMGVRLFFVLSGFLITGILLDARSAGLPLRDVARTFYVRRALRIFPLYYLALGIAALLAVLPAWPWYVAYASNVRAAQLGQFDDVVGHFWSLAVEEQFYLVWPALMLLVPRRLLPWALAAAALLAIPTRALLVWAMNPVAAYALMPARMDALAIGGLGAWAAREGFRIRHLWPAGLAVLAGVYGTRAAWPDSAPADVAQAFADTGYALVGLALVQAGAAGFRGWVGRLCDWRPVQYVGVISYGLYVWHLIVPEFVGASMPPRGWWHFAVAAPLTLAVAATSWHLVEAPINRLKDRVKYR